MVKEKLFIDLDNVWPGRFQPQFTPGKVFFCGITGNTTSTVKAISKVEALLRLLPQSASIFINQSFSQRQADALKRLIQGSDCYALEAGRDLYANPVKAAELLESV